MTRAKKNAKQIAAKMDAVQGTHIGSIVMWTLTGCQIDAAKLQGIYQAVGLDWKAWGLPDIDGDAAFSNAVREARRTAGQDGYRVVTLLESSERKVLGIVQETVDKAAEDVRYRTDWSGAACKVTHDRKNAAVKLSNPGHPLGQKIKALYQNAMGTYMVPDFIKLMTRNIASKMGGVTLRSKGGAYFVPSLQYDLLLRHQAMLEKVSADAEVFLGNLKDDAQTVKSVGRDARRSLAEELQELEVELKKWQEEPPRRDTIGRRMDEYKSLKAKCEMYASMLSIKVEDITSGLAVCEKQAKELLGVVEKKIEENAEKRKATIKANREAEKKQPAAEPKKVVKVEAPVAPVAPKKGKVKVTPKKEQSVVAAIVGAAK